MTPIAKINLILIAVFLGSLVMTLVSLFLGSLGPAAAWFLIMVVFGWLYRHTP